MGVPVALLANSVRKVARRWQPGNSGLVALGKIGLPPSAHSCTIALFNQIALTSSMQSHWPTLNDIVGPATLGPRMHIMYIKHTSSSPVSIMVTLPPTLTDVCCCSFGVLGRCWILIYSRLTKAAARPGALQAGMVLHGLQGPPISGNKKAVVSRGVDGICSPPP